MSDTSLEEVFLRVTAYTKQGQGAPSSVTINNNSINRRNNDSIESSGNFPPRRSGSIERPRRRKLSRIEKERPEELDQPLPYVTDSFGRELTPDPVKRSSIKYASDFTIETYHTSKTRLQPLNSCATFVQKMVLHFWYSQTARKRGRFENLIALCLLWK